MDQSTKAPKTRKRDLKRKLAQHRLSMLELAKELGNVAEACRQRGFDRTSFYEWKRRFQTQGFEGLKDLPPIHKSHPQTTSPETVERIRALALAHPAYGCNRFEAMLALEGVRVSSITIQKILNENGLGTKSDRWLALKQAHAETAIELTAEQATFIEKLNPYFRGRCTTTPNGRILDAATWADAPAKPSRHSSAKKVKWTTSGQYLLQLHPWANSVCPLAGKFGEGMMLLSWSPRPAPRLFVRVALNPNAPAWSSVTW